MPINTLTNTFNRDIDCKL